MACYGLLQQLGYDPINWAESPYTIVGTFSNPNYFAAYLIVTATITLGLSVYNFNINTKDRVFLATSFVIQAFVIFLLKSLGGYLGLLLGILLIFVPLKAIKPGKMLRYSPFIAGLIMAIALTMFHGAIAYSTANYPWEHLSDPPYRYFSYVARLTVWQMGYSVFWAQPLIGVGPGAVFYEMSGRRPPLAAALGLRDFNSDPHSLIISILSEIGFIGLVCLMTIIVIIYGAYVHRVQKHLTLNNQKAEPEETTKNDRNLKMGFCLVSVTVVATAYLIGLINGWIVFFSIALILTCFCVFNCIVERKAHDDTNLEKVTTATICVLLFHSLFNNNITLPPILTLGVLVTALHFCFCLKPIKWKCTFSWFAPFYILLPTVFVLLGYYIQMNYHNEQIMLFKGENAFKSGQYQTSTDYFKRAIRLNPQSLEAHHGLARSFQEQNNTTSAVSILKRLNNISTNVFNVNLTLAHILFDADQIIEANRHVIKSLQYNKLPSAYELLGRILLTQGRIEDALESFKEGLILIPAHRQHEREAVNRIKLNIAAIYANWGEYDACRRYLEQIRGRTRASFDSLYLRGLAKSNSGEEARALRLFEQALEMNPSNPRIMNAVGYVLAVMDRDLDRSKNLLESAFQIIANQKTPQLADVLMVSHSLGILNWKLGNYKQAEQFLVKAYTESPDEWEILKMQRLEDLLKFYLETDNKEMFEKFSKNE